jgi:hypothetical protein
MTAEQQGHTPGRQAIVRYLEMRRRRPLVGLDSVIHAIHTGTPYAASVSIEDIAVIVDRHDALISLVKRFAKALGHDETLQGGERVGLTDRSRIDGPALNAALIDAKEVIAKAEGRSS